MKLAIMQPYILPYIGYFQLINAVDKFVIYDDVNYINRGWVNRNNILINNQQYLFTVPLKNATQNKLIRDIEIDYSQDWSSKLLKTIHQSYKKAINFDNIFQIIESIVNKKYDNISLLNTEGLKAICNYLGINTIILESSSIYQNEYIKSQHRIIDICKKESANIYINPIGGIELYNKQLFSNHNISLYFLEAGLITYPQFSHQFVPYLSIIDILMFNSKEKIFLFLHNCELK